ncbi:hypothetical protein A2U01_0035069 [Trifolium medium]|uniref:Uncharacterized protein n=1 Tax=Trifolium medium TaxID=97028 RepID=A0A392PRK0_9FABA|nr:hypothetical protein [Trifolium medium]
MAEPAENHRLVDTITEPELAWVGPEPRRIASVITPTALGVYTIIEEDYANPDWEVHHPDADHRICSKFSDDGFGMYEFIFKDLKFRLPFSELAKGVFGQAYPSSFLSSFQTPAPEDERWEAQLGVFEAASEIIQDVYRFYSGLQGKVLHSEADDAVRDGLAL